MSSPSKKEAEIDWSKVRINNVYISDLSPEERQKYEPLLTPEKRAEHKQIAELEDQDMAYWRGEADRIHQESMRNGTIPRTMRFVLNQERKRQGLSDEDLMAKSGLDETALASMHGHDACLSIETMEAYARALGKKLLIVLADTEEGEGD